MFNTGQLAIAALVCSMAAISLSQSAERCDMCTCVVIKSELRLNCSDVGSKPGENANMIKIPYPESYNSYNYVNIAAEFNRNKIKVLSRLDIQKNLTKLSLEGNEISNIDQGTFMRVKKLRYLSLKDNVIETVDGKSFQGLEELETLDLSYNKLLGFKLNAFTELKKLKTLSISHNRLSNIEGRIFPDSIRNLDISHNSIVNVQEDVFDNLKILKNLNLSNNNITELSKFVLTSLGALTTLDLSHNSIKTIDSNPFPNLNSLRKLFLSHNALQEVHQNSELPAGIQILDMSNNFFVEIGAPVLAIKSLQELYMQQNNLKSVNITNASELKVLNVSSNQIDIFLTSLSRRLEVLDLSSNKLTSIPSQLQGGMMPALRWVSLDSNPIRQVRFPSVGDERISAGFTNLTWVSVSHLSELEELSEGDFSGLTSTCGGCGSNSDTTQELENLEQECTRKLTIRVAHNPRLANIQKGAFRDTAVCKLDLSYNSLSTLFEDVMDWGSLEEVDLQGNPWSCTCSLQWVLDTIMPKLYLKNQDLLYELRCETPAVLRNKRLVHFYSWEKSALCSSNMMGRMMVEPTQNEDVKVTLGFSGPMLAVVLSLAAIGVVLLVAAVVLQRRYVNRHRIRNRRF